MAQNWICVTRCVFLTILNGRVSFAFFSKVKVQQTDRTNILVSPKTAIKLWLPVWSDKDQRLLLSVWIHCLATVVSICCIVSADVNEGLSPATPSAEGARFTMPHCTWCGHNIGTSQKQSCAHRDPHSMCPGPKAELHCFTQHKIMPNALVFLCGRHSIFIINFFHILCDLKDLSFTPKLSAYIDVCTARLQRTSNLSQMVSKPANDMKSWNFPTSKQERHNSLITFRCSQKRKPSGSLSLTSAMSRTFCCHTELTQLKRYFQENGAERELLEQRTRHEVTLHSPWIVISVSLFTSNSRIASSSSSCDEIVQGSPENQDAHCVSAVSKGATRNERGLLGALQTFQLFNNSPSQKDSWHPFKFAKEIFSQKYPSLKFSSGFRFEVHKFPHQFSIP